MKRLLLLGVAVASLGAILAAGAFSNPTGTATSGGSTLVSVQPIANLSAALSMTDNEIPANGSVNKVADVLAGENDSAYAVAVTGVTLGGGYTIGGTCTGVTSDPFSISNPTFGAGDLTPDSATANIDVADLNLTLPVTVDSSCTLSNETVTVNFQAVAGPDI